MHGKKGFDLETVRHHPCKNNNKQPGKEIMNNEDGIKLGLSIRY